MNLRDFEPREGNAFDFCERLTEYIDTLYPNWKKNKKGASEDKIQTLLKLSHATQEKYPLPQEYIFFLEQFGLSNQTNIFFSDDSIDVDSLISYYEDQELQEGESFLQVIGVNYISETIIAIDKRTQRIYDLYDGYDEEYEDEEDEGEDESVAECEDTDLGDNYRGDSFEKLMFTQVLQNFLYRNSCWFALSEDDENVRLSYEIVNTILEKKGFKKIWLSDEENYYSISAENFIYIYQVGSNLFGKVYGTNYEDIVTLFVEMKTEILIQKWRETNPESERKEMKDYLDSKDKEFANCMFSIAKGCIKMCRLEEGLAFLNKSIRFHANRDNTYLRADKYFEMNRYEDALLDYQLAYTFAQDEDDKIEKFLSIIHCYVELKDYEKAKKLLFEALGKYDFEYETAESTENEKRKLQEKYHFNEKDYFQNVKSYYTKYPHILSDCFSLNIDNMHRTKSHGADDSSCAMDYLYLAVRIFMDCGDYDLADYYMDKILLKKNVVKESDIMMKLHICEILTDPAKVVLDHEEVICKAFGRETFYHLLAIKYWISSDSKKRDLYFEKYEKYVFQEMDYSERIPHYGNPDEYLSKIESFEKADYYMKSIMKSFLKNDVEGMKNYFEKLNCLPHFLMDQLDENAPENEKSWYSKELRRDTYSSLWDLYTYDGMITILTLLCAGLDKEYQMINSYAKLYYEQQVAIAYKRKHKAEYAAKDILFEAYHLTSYGKIGQAIQVLQENLDARRCNETSEYDYGIGKKCLDCQYKCAYKACVKIRELLGILYEIVGEKENAIHQYVKACEINQMELFSKMRIQFLQNDRNS